MRMKYVMSWWIVAFCASGVISIGNAQEVRQDACFYLNSLHFTANGMRYWYSKENGGLELLTGIPYAQLGCKNCHAAGCDRCHKVERGEKSCTTMYYSLDAATNQPLCLDCHGREKAMMRVDHKAGQEDVHLLQEMTCMDCHSQREMHGDGTIYDSLKQSGAMDTECENCHDDIKPTESHTIHKDHLDCKACHVRHVVSCTNCHFDTLLKTGKRKAIPMSGWLFLMNYKEKVTSASMQTFVVGENKTFLMFAPHMSHSITQQGRGCDDCHGTKNVLAVQKGKMELTRFKNGKVINTKGVIPVVDRVDYRCVYQNFNNGQWVPIKNPPKPVVQYVAFGTPLSVDQLEKLAAEQHAPPIKME